MGDIRECDSGCPVLPAYTVPRATPALSLSFCGDVSCPNLAERSRPIALKPDAMNSRRQLVIDRISADAGQDRGRVPEPRSDLADHVRPELERYLELFCEKLRREYAPAERIDALREKFRKLPAGREHLPCPRCFVGHRYERMATLTFTGQYHALRCRQCGATIVVETGI